MSIKPKYWSERQAKLNAQLEKDETKLNAKLEKEYKSIEAELEKEIGAYYSKYGKDNVIEYRKLLLELPDADKELLYKKMDTFAEKYPEYAHLMPVRESIYKLNRLEGLEHDIYINQCKVGAITEKELKNHLEKLALKSYLAAGGRNLLNVYAIEKLVNKKWLDGGNFSTRIWGNVDLVANHLQNEFRNSIIRGDAYERNIEAMMRKFGVNRSNARRLIYTEGTFVMNEASMTAFEGDYERYKYASLMDSKTSSICRHLNGKVFKIKDREAGINFPPMHPNCRSSYTIVIGDETEKKLEDKKDEALGKNSTNSIENLNADSEDSMADDNINSNDYKPLNDKQIEEYQSKSDIIYDRLTDNERMSLKDYTQGGYLDINTDLRYDIESEHTNNLNSAINNFTIDSNIITYRGTSNKYYKGYKVGDTFEGKVFYSTSLDREQAKAFMNDITLYSKDGSKGILLEIRVPKGGKGLYIGNNTDYKSGNYTVNERELLLSNKTKYKIISITKDRMILEVVP